MYRTLIILVLAAVLAACSTQGDADGAETESSDTGASAATSAAPEASGDASRTTGGEASAACAEAFAPIAEMNLESTSELGDVAEVEATVESCESIDDWVAGAQTVLPDEVNPSTARLLLDIRCADPSLSGTVICQELASS